ncbi:hypothetical protein ACPV33_23910 [Vibrio harveyi]|uniref:hypothetical protein n=1 Tax=Vibrio harveyi group TaxID=717610 RepID=UPI0015F7133D|nr:hypothetical protein [Vibrio rotiferianus]
MKKLIDLTSSVLISDISLYFRYATKSDIENADGRKNKECLITKKASTLYIALENEKVLYVGETSKSLKRRFISDGTGSHREACGIWYKRMTHVKYIQFSNEELPTMHRKLMEQALSIQFNPEFYGSRLNK